MLKNQDIFDILGNVKNYGGNLIEKRKKGKRKKSR